MAAILDFSKFSFGAEQIRAVKELLFDEVIAAPEISLLHTVYPGIVYDKEVGFIGEGGLVGVAHQGCDPEPQAWSIATRMVKWEPKRWEILIHQCAKDLEDTAAIYSMKTGIAMDDFESSDYMAIVVEVLLNSIKEFVIRLFWFNDTDADNVADGGEITNGVSPSYFNIINGLFKQMIAAITADSKRGVTIEENDAETYELQALNPANVKNKYLPQIYYGADIRLRQNKNKILICTQSFYDAYEQSLDGTNIESMYVNITDGIKVLKYKGLPLFPMPVWDKIILAYYNTGAKLINPHRAVLATKDVLAVGVDSESSFGDMDIWYNKDERKVKCESQGKADAKLLDPKMFQLAI